MLLTFRSIEETAQCFNLDGIFYVRRVLSQRRKALRFRRPAEYDAEMKTRRVEGSRILPKMDVSHIKMCKAGSAFFNTFNKLFFAGFSADLE